MTPAGLVPGTIMAPRVRSRQPIDRTIAFACSSSLPSSGEIATILRSGKDHRVEKKRDAIFKGFVDNSLCIFRPRQLLLELLQPKPGMDALVQNTAEEPVPFDNEDIAQSLIIGRRRGGQPGWAAADDNQIVFAFHVIVLLVTAGSRLDGTYPAREQWFRPASFVQRPFPCSGQVGRPIAAARRPVRRERPE